MLKQALITAESLIVAFFLAVSKGDLEGCLSLIQQGAYPDARDEKGNSALMTVVSDCDSPELARMLLDAGATVNGTNSLSGETPLFMASRAGNEDAVTLLLELGADPNVASRSGYTPLMAAADYGHTGVVEKLLRGGANSNVRTHRGVTAVMRAAEQGNPETVQTLVGSGADVNAADHNGETALMIAAAFDYEDVVRVLLEAGADHSMANNSGWTAPLLAEAKTADMLRVASTDNGQTDTVLAVPSSFVEELVA